MKRHFQTPVITPVKLQLSREEFAILEDEQHATVTELASGGQDIDRLIDTEDGTTATLTIVDQTPQIEPLDASLVNCVSDAMVAGTDADPEDLLQLTPDGLVGEGFVEDTMTRLKAMWEKVKAFLQQVFEHIKKYLTGEKRLLENVKDKAESIDKLLQEHREELTAEPTVPTAPTHDPEADAAKLAEAKARTAEKREANRAQSAAELKEKLAHHTFRFKGNISHLTVGQKVPENIEKEVTHLASYTQQLHKTIGTILKDLSSAFDQVLARFDQGKADAAIHAFVDQFHRDLARMGNSIGGHTSIDGLERWHTQEKLLGQFAVELTDNTQKTDDLARQLRQATQAEFTVSSGTQKADPMVPLMTNFTSPATGVIINRWIEFKLSHDVEALHAALYDYFEKFFDKIDRLVDVQAAVKADTSEAGSQAYHLIQGLITMCRSMGKLNTNFSTQYGYSVGRILMSVLDYQKQSIEERLHLTRKYQA